MRPKSRGCLLAELIDSLYRKRVEAAGSNEEGVRHPLMRGWQVLEEVSVGAETYILLRRAKPTKLDGTGVNSLTAREREVLQRASVGASNKEIAHQMEVSASTVGVLLWRAARKVSAINREDLLRRVAHLECG